MKILYCDCFSGISGDMFLAAMLDAGLTPQYLSAELKKLNLPEFKGVQVQAVMKGAMRASLLDFELNGSNNKHNNGDDHTHDHLHSHEEHEHIHEHPHQHVHEHTHGHEHDHQHDLSHPHEHAHGAHRHYSDIKSLITTSALSETVKEKSLLIFQRLAEAEARVHGMEVDDVAFHEVGAIDSILDIVGAAVALDYFKIEKLFASALPLGSGTVKTQHGLLPLPAPATLELLNLSGAKVIPSPAQKELITPTGAAILAALATFEQPGMQIKHLGIGAGRADLPWPNILRLVFGEV